MNRSFDLAAARAPFKSATQYLSSALTSASSAPNRPSSSSSKHRRSDSLDENYRFESPQSQEKRVGTMDVRATRSNSSSSLQPTASSIPLISLSRSPSPYPRSKSAAQSEDEDDDDYEQVDRPLMTRDIGSGGGKRAVFTQGAVGRFLFDTTLGWYLLNVVLVGCTMGASYMLVFLNRGILWTGVYKFPYPLTVTFTQLVLIYLFLLGFASLSRGLSKPLQIIGLEILVAPSTPAQSSSSPRGYRGPTRGAGALKNFSRWLLSGTGGIAGGGFFELDMRIARRMAPLAAVFVGKVVLSNLSFAYAVLPVYTLSRIAVVPLTLLLTSFLSHTSHSVSTLSSALIATLNLLMTSIWPNQRSTWESIVAGVFSTLFVSLYPILLLQAYSRIKSELPRQKAGDDIVLSDDPYTADTAALIEGTRQQENATRAYYTTLHYASLLSITFLAPIVLLSGEPFSILRNCYFLDVPFFWFVLFSSGFFSFAIFIMSLLVVEIMSPVTSVMTAVPRQALQLVVFKSGRVPVHVWVGASLCWASSVWFAGARWDEGRQQRQQNSDRKGKGKARERRLSR